MTIKLKSWHTNTVCGMKGTGKTWLEKYGLLPFYKRAIIFDTNGEFTEYPLLEDAKECEVGTLKFRYEPSTDSPKELDKVAKNFRETIRGALADPNKGRGNACSVVLADAIIVLEAPPGAEVCSTNAKHFEPICRTLGKRFRDARVNATPNDAS